MSTNLKTQFQFYVTSSPHKHKEVAMERDLLNQILSTYIFYDTVAFWVPRHLNPCERDTLESLCVGGINYIPTKEDEPVFLVSGRNRWPAVVKIQLNQPTKDAITFIERITHKGFAPRLYRVDITAEFVTQTDRAANQLKRYLHSHIKKSWFRPDHRLAIVGIADDYTFYVGERKRRMVIAGYSGLPSKITGMPCCRLEFRMTRHQTLKDRNLINPTDILGFDPVSFFLKNLNLCKIDRKKLGLLLRKRHGNCAIRTKFHRFLYDHEIATANNYLRNILYRDHDLRVWNHTWGPIPTVLKFVAAFREHKINLTAALKKISNASLLAQAEFVWPTFPNARAS